MARKFVSHTSASETVDGSKGQNNRMERGSSVVSNPIWEPGGPNSPEQRFESPEYANQTSDEGAISVRHIISLTTQVATLSNGDLASRGKLRGICRIRY